MSESGLLGRLRAQAVMTLRKIPADRADLNEKEFLAIRNASREGIGWDEIADVLGLGTAEAAQRRYEELRERV